MEHNLIELTEQAKVVHGKCHEIMKGNLNNMNKHVFILQIFVFEMQCKSHTVRN